MNNILTKQVNTLLILSFTAAVGLLLWHSDSPYPLVMDWDMFAHQHVINAIVHGHISIFPTHISDTFLLNTYFPTFAVLIGLGRKLFYFLPLTGYYFVLDTIHYVVVITVGSLLGYVVSKRYAVAVLSGVLSAFVFESVIAQTAMFLIPQTLATVCIVLGNILWLRGYEKWGLVLLYGSILIHFVIGTIGVGCGLLFTLANYLERKFSISVPKVLIYIGLSVVILSVLFESLGDFNPFSSQESVALTFGLGEKLDFLLSWYSPLIVAYVLGVWRVMKNRDDHQLYVVGISLGLLAAVFLPIPYSLKFLTVTRFFVGVTVAIGLVWLIDSLSRQWVRNVAYTVVWLIMLNVFVHSTVSFKSSIPYNDSRTTVSEFEIEAATFIKDKYSEKYGSVLLVSDPATQHVFEALSGVNSQGGAFASSETRSLVANVYPSVNQQDIEALFAINDTIIDRAPETVLLIVSGRFIQWQNTPDERKYDQTFSVWAPRDLTPLAFEYVEQLASIDNVTKVFENKGVVVFEINKP